MPRILRQSLCAAVFLAAGCGATSDMPPVTNSDPNMLVGFDPGPKPQNGLQVILPVMRTIMPGTDYEYCTWTDQILDHDLDVKGVQAFQSTGGHHVVLFYTKNLETPNTTRLCTDDDMATFRFAAGAGGEGQGMNNEAPGNLAFHIPKGAQLVINHHYINASTKPIDAQSSTNLYFADPAAHSVRSSSLAIVDTELKLAPGKPALDINCTMENDFKAWLFIPHMHEWGHHIVVERTSAALPQPEVIFDLDWQVSYQFHPPEIRREPAQAYQFAKGDKIHVRCEWNNDSGKELPFGLEMCVAFGQTVDDTGIGNLACNAGTWGEF